MAGGHEIRGVGSGNTGRCNDCKCGHSDDVPMDFEVSHVTVSFDLTLVGTRGDKLTLSYENGYASSLEEANDGCVGAINTLVGFLDSRS